MSDTMTPERWAAYWRRGGTRRPTDIRCTCGEHLLRAASTSMYPCLGCGLAAYPIDIDWSKREVIRG